MASPILPALHPRHRSRPFEVENLGRGSQSGPEQRLRRQQRNMMASDAVHLDEIAPAEILDPRCVEREHPGLSCSSNVPHQSPPMPPRQRRCVNGTVTAGVADHVAGRAGRRPEAKPHCCGVAALDGELDIGRP